MKRTIFWIGAFALIVLPAGLVGFFMQLLSAHPTVAGISGVAVGIAVFVKIKELERRWFDGQASK